MAQPRFGHFFEVIVYHRIENTIEFEAEAHKIKCRVASNKEKRSYQVLNGLFDENSNIAFFTQDEIDTIKPNDKILFMNEIKLVTSTGVYLNKTRNLCAYNFDDEYIIANAPKGFSIQ